MDTGAFIGKLKNIFSEINNRNNRYAQVWLSEHDIGGFYSGKYVIKIKAGSEIESSHQEIRSVINTLHEKASEEFKLIWRVAVYNKNEYFDRVQEDILVFDSGWGNCLA